MVGYALALALPNGKFDIAHAARTPGDPVRRRPRGNALRKPAGILVVREADMDELGWYPNVETPEAR
ncbi:hypothetical protein ONZ51_g10205 [Trametes cubensis]|uniref:Uncharacterized protein n=1 Tax=Trametes cubensis TaxID=1111947 RepID=A0AAD7TJY4_9APHY|nr:hypothetical protein ONZ51_g10205 [Trametes cubensis]